MKNVDLTVFYCAISRAGEPEPGVAGCFWLLGAGAAWKKKSGAGAAKKLTGSSALLEAKKHKEIVRL